MKRHDTNYWCLTWSLWSFLAVWKLFGFLEICKWPGFFLLGPLLCWSMGYWSPCSRSASELSVLVWEALYRKVPDLMEKGSVPSSLSTPNTKQFCSRH